MHQVTENLYELPLKGVNAHLITGEESLVLIDTGSPGSAEAILASMAHIGRQPSDLTHIIVTHCHPDHAGSLAALQAATNAITLMHPLDAEMVRAGRSVRPLTPTPGLLNRLLFRFFIAPAPRTIDPARVDQTLTAGQVLPLAGGLQVIHAPGHSAGQIALLWPARGVLFAADTVMNLPRLGYSLGYEDYTVGRETAVRLSSFSFETAVFGHGKPLVSKAQAAFRKRFSAASTSLWLPQF